MQLRARGVSDARLLSAIERVPRRLFLAARQHVLAYVDTQLPIECGQSISAPSTIATMLEHLKVGARDSVLEIGTGSGYQAALLSHLAARVVTLERYRTLVELARQRLATLRMDSVQVELADGLLGWAKEAPFGRIIVTGSVEAIPEALKAQLDPDGGVLIAPVGVPGQPQKLTRVVRSGDDFAQTEVAPVRFVPMVAGIAARL
ncbi:protein-L-isoaspartate(D-aspartate) O-methyltransferase [Breoghania sp. L-A4]|uniref:protein-L-isoaspartate(D-aspartate) O-methyltransferase n=1 Tax=Breoghania sp. L-A4 TaxID=2304600 RepID=UPI000E35F703|nr:protein-L-isoaspartate(D-aspartate) O-methyltransferase [Breoghania sp. L-A4]AXS40537.1 protein-L-isoaspartate(D-aspartate) O-methyltransferase [Breoghania sp. L-A4]